MSLVVSVALTVLLNVALRLFPGPARWIEDSLHRLAAPPPGGEPPGPRVRVVFPWKLMLIGSVVLTIAVNVLARVLG